MKHQKHFRRPFAFDEFDLAMACLFACIVGTLQFAPPLDACLDFLLSEQGGLGPLPADVRN